MSGEIKRIDSIKNMAVFQDFRWSSAVRDKGNNVAEFKKINIFYGRNYSRKTAIQECPLLPWGISLQQAVKQLMEMVSENFMWGRLPM